MMNDDIDIKRLMKQESAGAQLIAFVLAAIFGAAAGAAGVTLREALLSAAMSAIYSAELEINQYTGFAHIAEIATIGVVAAAWLMLVLLVWHRIGSEFEIRNRLRIWGVWTAGALITLAAAWMLGVVV